MPANECTMCLEATNCKGSGQRLWPIGKHWLCGHKLKERKGKEGESEELGTNLE